MIVVVVRWTAGDMHHEQAYGPWIVADAGGHLADIAKFPNHWRIANSGLTARSVTLYAVAAPTAGGGVVSLTHGASAYRSKRACRCAVCTDAHAMRASGERELRAAQLRAGEISVVHGSASTYRNYMCRCDPCKAANSARSRARRARKAAAS